MSDQFRGPWVARDAEDREGEPAGPLVPTQLPAPAPLATPPPDWPWTGLVAAQVEAVQVGGQQYRVLMGSFGVDALGARCHWRSDGGLQYEAALTALEGVRMVPPPPAP